MQALEAQAEEAPTPDRVAVVGSRHGVPQERVWEFLGSLFKREPETIIVSGGAEGVDRTAESYWRLAGGTVWSYRPRALTPDEWGIDFYVLSNEAPRSETIDFPTWADFKSAAWYRNMLVAESSQRMVSFMAPGGSPGTMSALDAARALERPVHIWDEGTQRWRG